MALVVLYVGRVDNDFNKELLRTFVCQLCCENVYKRGSLLNVNRDPKVRLACREKIARQTADSLRKVGARFGRERPARTARRVRAGGEDAPLVGRNEHFDLLVEPAIRGGR
mmetsp:Transcript_27416/g.69150  ORF Transcript_27416/g.69150 Transcript_27416/m.69150 type:complete len:111 (+) Transcript_27416:1424-1756(+)